jgi:hypothetical protein
MLLALPICLHIAITHSRLLLRLLLAFTLLTPTSTLTFTPRLLLLTQPQLLAIFPTLRHPTLLLLLQVHDVIFTPTPFQVTITPVIAAAAAAGAGQMLPLPSRLMLGFLIKPIITFVTAAAVTVLTPASCCCCCCCCWALAHACTQVV